MMYNFRAKNMLDANAKEDTTKFTLAWNNDKGNLVVSWKIIYRIKM